MRTTFQRNWISPSAFYYWTSCSYLHFHFTLAKLKPIIIRSLVPTHICALKSKSAILSILPSIKTVRNKCRKANDTINKVKVNSWKYSLQNTMSNAVSLNLWNGIQGLKSTPDSNSPNGNMSDNGWTIKDTKTKANIFVNHYARVKRFHIWKEDWYLSCLLKKTLDNPSINNKSCPLIKMGKLISVIQMKKQNRGVAPENITPTFLKLLGPLALQQLLSIFNASFQSAACPHIWGVAIINELLKAIKSPADVGFFQRINLRSFDGKLLDQIFQVFIALLNLTTCLVNFKLHLGEAEIVKIEDQLTWLFQATEYLFQQCPMQQSVLILLYFSKTCTTVWQKKILLQMLDAGIPSNFIPWLHFFFDYC